MEKDSCVQGWHGKVASLLKYCRCHSLLKLIQMGQEQEIASCISTCIIFV